jgi:hypothetical protein
MNLMGSSYGLNLLDWIAARYEFTVCAEFREVPPAPK